MKDIREFEDIMFVSRVDIDIVFVKKKNQHNLTKRRVE